MRTDTLPHLLFDHANKHSDRIALRKKYLGIWRETPWGSYREQVANFSLGLLSLGMGRGDRIAVLSENNPEWLYADLATQLAGGITIGIYPTNPPHQVKYILGHSESKSIVVGDQEQADKILEVRQDLPHLEKMIVIDMKGLWNHNDPFILSFEEVEELGLKSGANAENRCADLLNMLQPGDTARIIYTSGTTGSPKGAMVSHRNLLSTVSAMIEANKVYHHDEIVSYLPLCHVAELCYSICIPLLSGCAVNFAESIDTVQQDLREIFPTVFVAVPRIWEKMHSSIFTRMQDASSFKRLVFRTFLPIGERRAKTLLTGGKIGWSLRMLWGLGDLFIFRKIRKNLGLSRVHNCLSGAAALSPDIHRFLHAIGVEVVQGYGLTEVAGITHVQQRGEVRPGTCGLPVDGVKTKLAEDGEILISCEGVFQGYYRDIEATRKTVMENGWLRTGDIGTVTEEGHLAITDRKKDIIITSGGENIAPTEMENRLKVSPYIKEAIVVGDGRKYLCCLIQIDHENVADWAQRHHVVFTTFKSLAENALVHELIDREITKANEDFASVWQIKKFHLLTKELDHDDDELTATQKVRREQISTQYYDQIESLYST